MKKIILTTVVILTMTMLYSANDKVGTTSAVFTKINVSPKVVSLGGAYTSLSDVNSVLVNPAGLAGLQSKEVTFSWTQWLLDTSLGYLAFSMPVGSLGNIGIGLNTFNAGEMEEVDSNANVTGQKFSASDMLLSIVYARSITEKIGVGVGIKYISQTIDDKSAMTPSLDIGGNFALTEKIKLGLAVQHLFGGIKFIDEEYKLPMNIKLGGSMVVIDNLMTALDITLPSDNVAVVGLGVEYNLKFSDFALPIRVGYKTGSDIEGAGISAGLGFGFKDMVYLDLTWSPVSADFGGQAINAGLSLKF